VVLSCGQICCGSWGLNAVVDELFLRHSSAEPDTWRRIAITVRARFRLTENAGAASLPGPPQHRTHGALHRAAADTLQGFLALKQRTVAVLTLGAKRASLFAYALIHGIRMLRLETKADLDALHTGNIKESISLEYKASPAIDKNDNNKKVEMARDVSAFANANGGQIVYGMTEKDHEPTGLDNGVDEKAYPEIWFEQVLQQHIRPPIPGLGIRHVPLITPMVAVVIEVPATKADPHQVSDGRYYRRHNYNRLIMEHYEVRDSMRRAVDPALVVGFDLLQGDAAYKTVEFNQYGDQSDPIAVGAVVRNNSNQPSMYTVVSIFIDRRVKILNPGNFENPNFQKFSETDIRHHLRHSMGIPGGYPIFREMPVSLGPFQFTISDRLLGQKLALGYQVRAPGCFEESHGHIEIGQSGQMWLRMPPS
jgi:hypothetical protein